MASQFGPIEIACDAPPYPIVEACWMLGFQSAPDVRWCRMSTFLHGEGEGGSVFSLQSWKGWLGMGRARGHCCSCGEMLPTLEKCTFTFLSGSKTDYLLGQCPRCRTIFWEEP
jgi:hypothetical protein